MPDLEALVGPAAEHAGRYGAIARSDLDAAARSGAEVVAQVPLDAPVDLDDVVTDLGTSVCGPLRERLAACLTDSAGDEPTPKEVVSRLRAFLPEFERAGVKLALENHDRFSSRTLAAIIEQAASEHVGICLDTVNSFGALEGPEVVVETLAPYALNLHLKDFTIERVSSQMGFVVTGSPAGEGRLDLTRVLECLRTAGRDVNAILELWPPFGPTLEDTITREREWVETSVRNLRKFIPD